MATSPYHISSLLDKMSSVDKDFRFMATNDLMTELQRDSIKLDDDSERKVVQAILRLVEDKNGEVQNLAVRCLGPLVCKIKDGQVEVIVNQLCGNMFSDDERLRDISSVGLKTVISQLPFVSSNVSSSVCKNITNKLVNSIDKPSLNQYVLLEGLDILGDLIHRYGVLLTSYHQQLQESLMPLLMDPRPVSVRKRAYMALCFLSSCCSQDLYDSIMTLLLNNLKTDGSSLINTRTFIQCIGAISRQSGQRVIPYLDVIVPVLMNFVKSEDDELKESCLQTFEVLVCFREISPNLNDVIKVCLQLLAHDPNYNYESDDETEEEAMETDEFDEDDDSYSDDDDISWKVRRASAKTLAAIHTARPDLIVEFYTTISPALIGRFKEREENVRCDIFLAYRALLNINKPINSNNSSISSSDVMETSETNPLSLLQTQVPLIVKSLHKQLKDKSIKARQGCFALLTDLVTVLPGALEKEVGHLVPGIVYCLNDTGSSSNMRIDTLMFLNVLLTNHSPSSLYQFIDTIIPAVIRAVNDSFYKITSEALLVLQLIVKIIRPLDDDSSFNYGSFAEDIYECAMKRLSAADIDQEVKERAITAMGQILANLGDCLESKLSQCLPVYVNRLNNEITRLTTVRALTVISRSPLKLDITMILADTVPLLATFLRKNHRDLKLATLACLTQLMNSYAISRDLIKQILEELPPLISDNDLHIAQHVISLICTIMNISPSSMDGIKVSILPNIMTMLLSSLLQGNPLNTVANFFSQLVLLDIAGLRFKDIFEMLVSHVQGLQSGATAPPTLHKQAYQSLSRCIAVISVAIPDNIQSVVTKFMTDVQSPEASEPSKLLALFSIGEIGKQCDLSSISSLHIVVIDVFGSPSEELRSAASYSLGCISSGNLGEYLPFILTEIQSSPKRQYLLLHSLKEIISNAVYDKLKQHVVHIWDVLFHHFQSTEEGTRNVVAECVGKLTLVDPQTLLPKLKENLASESAHVRGTVITAFKYTISDQPHPIDSQLQDCIEEFMKSISDSDLNVRRMSLVAFNSAAHNKPSLIADLLDTILPNLYNETKVKKELIRQVEMGPFKHTVDDGLDLRKAAFECMYTLLETCLTRIDVFEFINHVEDGLRDHYDIKMLTFLLLVRLSYLRPTTVLQRIEKLLEPLRATVQSRVKANSVKQEFEKQEEMKRSAIRCVIALLAIPDADKNSQLMEFVQQIKSNADTAALYESVRQDSTLAATPTRHESMDLS
ncbi:PREDICTED: cullin-associated NEDD8-dissociated protein 1-like [Amphimedon queenslandica]|uniref:TATA-binding protein interacting (TIP20) domain-containing protein n=1 Tax=Amphimedon queenslandica TaxID=400682 RepID=A0A1X7VCL5_AMPQE|nr:PREDICTED: cullin-associated NEDD8-dissociated protein 1-like [Amphimedon queenslandica]|eukprot:XP_019849564.1 PREDICTED: cullin-associated NEDD8-dissociated protein 1-like [Amphimedon queenslandica]